MCAFSASQCARSAPICSRRSPSSRRDGLAPLGRGRVGLALGQRGVLDLEPHDAALSSSSSVGSESISMRSRLAASSIRSIALSGRKRSVM